MTPRRPLIGLVAAGLALLAACDPAPKEDPLPAAPLLETLPATYRPIDRQDTLESFWAPDSAFADTLFQFTEAHRSRVLVRAQFVPAAAMRQAGRDTLTFRHTYSELFADNRTGYRWYYSYRYDDGLEQSDDSAGVPLRLLRRITNRLVLSEYRRWPQNDATYERNAYIQDYPFHPVAVAKVSDSVVYVRAFLVRPDVPRPDTLVAYFRSGPRRKRVPYVADQLDTARLATIRFSFRQLSHSPNLD